MTGITGKRKTKKKRNYYTIGTSKLTQGAQMGDLATKRSDRMNL